MISKVLSLKPQPQGSLAEICRDAGGGSGAVAAAAGAGDAASGAGVPALGSHPERQGEGQRILLLAAAARLFQVVSD